MRTDQGVPSHTDARVQEIFQALDTSRQIWNNLAGENREAGKVELVLDTMLELLRPKLGLPDRLAPTIDVAVSVDGERGGDGAKDSNMDMVDLNWVRCFLV
jgi:hypothetical protein